MELCDLFSSVEHDFQMHFKKGNSGEAQCLGAEQALTAPLHQAPVSAAPASSAALQCLSYSEWALNSLCALQLWQIFVLHLLASYGQKWQ